MSSCVYSSEGRCIRPPLVKIQGPLSDSDIAGNAEVGLLTAGVNFFRLLFLPFPRLSASEIIALLPATKNEKSVAICSVEYYHW